MHRIGAAFHGATSPRRARSRSITAVSCLLASLALSALLTAQVPPLLHYQGRVQVGTNDFNGTGQFKFALVSADGATSYWSHDGTASGQPATAVALPVTKGLYSVLLGNTNLAGMSGLPASALTAGDAHLRVWFNDGVSGFQQFVPDQRIAASAYALVAGNAQSAASVPPGAITSAMLSSGAVTADKLAAGAVTSSLTPGSIPGAAVADGSITADKLAPTPVPVGGTLVLISESATNTATNLEWLELPSVTQSISLVQRGRWFDVVTGRREVGRWTVRRPLTTDYTWKEWVREVAVGGSPAAARKIILQFPAGPSLVLSNALPVVYSMEVAKEGFRESLTIHASSLQIQ